MFRFLVIVLAGLGLASIGYFCMYQRAAPAIQADIQSRAEQALTANGASWVEVEVDGRDITLSGVAPSHDMRLTAERLVQVEGFNFIDNRMTLSSVASSPVTPSALAAAPSVAVPPASEMPTIEPVPQAWSLKITREKEGKLVLDGVLDEPSARRLLHEAGKHYDEDHIVNDIHVMDEVVPELVANTASNALTKLNALEHGQVLLTDGKLLVSGGSSSRMVVREVTQQLQAGLPEGFEGDFDLVHIEPEVADQEAGTTETDAASAIAQISAQECQKLFNASLKKPLRFNRSSSVLKKSSYPLLNEIATTANRCQKHQITVHGHTDSSGRNSANKRLSQKRAQAVVNYLVEQQVDGGRLKAVGHGSSKPIASNKTKRGRARNRRIELTVEVKN